MTMSLISLIKNINLRRQRNINISLKYCCHVLAAALDFYLDMMEQIHKQIHGDTGPKFVDSLALQEIIETWSLLVSFLVAFLDHTRLS